MSEEKLRTKIRQDQIVLAAFELIASQGLRSLKVADVARRIGLVPSAIYRHFRSKDDIIDAVLDHIQEMLLGNVETVCEETSVALERLRRLLFRHIQLIRANVAIPRILFSDEIYFGRPGRKKTMYVCISDYLTRVEAIIHQGQAKDGGIDPTIDPKTVSVMFLGLVQPTGLLWHISGGRFDATKQAEKAWRLFSRTIAASDCEFIFTKISQEGKKEGFR